MNWFDEHTLQVETGTADGDPIEHGPEGNCWKEDCATCAEIDEAL